MSQLVTSLAVLAAAGLTTACGNTPTDRALTGGAVGAATTPRPDHYGGGY
jgi:hypothetical protein